VDGEIVGAIGLSGAPTVQNDIDCARAALALVSDAVLWDELVSQVGDYMAERNRFGRLAAKSNRPAQSLATGWTSPSQYPEISMNNYTHQTRADPNSMRRRHSLAYRSLRGARVDIPLLFLCTLPEPWITGIPGDRTVCQDREVILFNNAGVSSSSGEVRLRLKKLAQHAAAFIDALGVKKLDALGFSIGGFRRAAVHHGPARPCPKTHPRWHWPKGWRGDGIANPEGQEIFEQVRSCR